MACRKGTVFSNGPRTLCMEPLLSSLSHTKCGGRLKTEKKKKIPSQKQNFLDTSPIFVSDKNSGTKCTLCKSDDTKLRKSLGDLPGGEGKGC